MKKYIDICWNAIRNGWSKSWTWYKGLYKERKWYTKAGIGFASFIVAFMLYLIMVDINFLWLFGRSPGLTSIMHPKTVQASELYSADGVLIGKYFSENRTPVEYEVGNLDKNSYAEYQHIVSAPYDFEGPRTQIKYYDGYEVVGIANAARGETIGYDCGGCILYVNTEPVEYIYDEETQTYFGTPIEKQKVLEK